MVKVEYGDFYKFLSSLGVTIIGVSLLFSWLFLKEPFTWSQLPKNSDLSQNAITFIKKKEELLLDFTFAFRYFLVISIFTGLFLLVLGLILWYRSQREIDRNQKLVNQKIEKELIDMTPAEIVNSVILDTIDSSETIIPENEWMGEEKNETFEIHQDSIYETKKHTEEESGEASLHFDVSSHLDFVKKYMYIEEVVFHKLMESFEEPTIILRNKKIGRIEFDIVIQSNQIDNSDYIIEIKYIQSRNALPSIINAKHKVIAASEIYTRATNRSVIPIVLVVVSNDYFSKASILNYKRRFSEESNLKQNDIHTLIISEEELKKLSSDNIRDIITFNSKNVVA